MSHVAQTILAQLGGNKFLAMTGATVSRDGDALIAKLPRRRAVVIKLTPADLYDVELVTMNAKYEITRKSVDGVHVENLREVFTSLTGLDTSL